MRKEVEEMRVKLKANREILEDVRMKEKVERKKVRMLEDHLRRRDGRR